MRERDSDPILGQTSPKFQSFAVPPSKLLNNVEFRDPSYKLWRLRTIRTLLLFGGAGLACSISSQLITPEPRVQPTEAIPWDYEGLARINCESDTFEGDGKIFSLRMGNGATLVFKLENRLLKAESTDPALTNIEEVASFSQAYRFRKGDDETYTVANCGGFIAVRHTKIE